MFLFSSHKITTIFLTTILFSNIFFFLYILSYQQNNNVSTKLVLFRINSKHTQKND